MLINYSSNGNYLSGTENVRNYLEVTDGNNSSSGGHLADELHGGLGNDRMEGKAGNATYHIKGSTTINDTADNDTLILMATGATAREELWFNRQVDDLLIRFRSDSCRAVTVQNYYDKPDQKIEHIVMNGERLSGGHIHNLLSAMASMQVFPDSAVVQSSPLLTEALGRWSLITTLAA